MLRRIIVIVGVLCVTSGGAIGVAEEHPGSDSKCERCHLWGKGDADSPKVVPEKPGFWARLFGAKSFQGHPSVSCAGSIAADGSITGCHRPEEGLPHLLVENLAGKPSDVFCGRCHPDHRVPGRHHPTYKSDKDEDGIAETIVRPAPAQEVYTTYDPAALGEPLASHPDAIVFELQPDGSKRLKVALPLGTVVEVAEGQSVPEPNVVMCSTCHNPHCGYLVETGSEEELNRELLAREEGDALLRLRDHDNTLCEACH